MNIIRCIVFIMASLTAVGYSNKTDADDGIKSSMNPMTEIDEYILNSIKLRVWSGFDSPDDVDSIIDDLLEEGANESMLRDAVAPEFARKREAEKNWPKVTDNDRLETVFNALDELGVLCLHDAGYTMSDGHYDANEAIEEHPNSKYYGYCFYHGQDLERAVDGGGLTLAFDHVGGDVPDKLKVGVTIKDQLEKAGFILDWDGSTKKRITIPDFDWKRR